jgi:hypothetical protein
VSRGDRSNETDRFWSHVDKDGPVHPVLGTRCWIWTAYRKANGYGLITVWRDGRWVRRHAHREVWTVVGQPLADGENSLHRCDNPACVNVDEHLFKGSQADNLRDAGAKGRMARDVRGERHPQAKLTRAQVDAIRSAHPRNARGHRVRVPGLTRSLAAQYNTTVAYINHLCCGAGWKEG